MYEIDTKLKQISKENKDIGIGIIGAGQMGTEIVCQIGLMLGMKVHVVVDIKNEIAMNAYRVAETTDEVAIADTLQEAERLTLHGKRIVTTNYHIATQLSSVDVIIDSTGLPEMGARIALECFNNKKHIVMMNVECDVTVGPILRKMAENAGVVYSLTAGDEPGSILELYRFAKSIGYDVVAAGKGKNNPLNIYATPADWKEEAEKRCMSPRMLVEFVDGSKTMIEMAAVSNATGLLPDKQGMHGAACNVDELTKTFSLKKDGGILNKSGVVDFAIGDVAPGVFVVFTTKNEQLIEGLRQRLMGNGPNYLLYRPYHLCSSETPITAAQAVIYNESTAHPMNKLVSECITISKRDLKAGEALDRIGEYCYRGSIEAAEKAQKGNMLPLGLAYGATMKVDIKKDTIITYDMVTFNEKDSVLLQLRRIQDIVFN